MSGDTPDTADTIESGKRLVRARAASGSSLGERLLNQFYRLTWRTPIHAFKLRGRYPLKLLTVPDDPVLGDADRGLAMLDGIIRWRGETQAIVDCTFGATNWSRGFSDYMHSFAWLRDLAAVKDRAVAAPVAEHLMRAWLSAHAENVTDAAWRGDLAGKRILYWAAHAPLILSSTDLVYRSSVLNTLARTARHLERVADRTPIGIARVQAWSGVIAAGLLMPGGEPRRTFGEAGLQKALAGAFTYDGGSVCRSPNALADGIVILSMLVKAYEARRIPPDGLVADVLSKAVPALQGVVLGDGGLSSWQGGLPLAKPDMDAILRGSGIRSRPLRQARDWGYQRINAGDTIIVMDAAPPPVSRLVETGCASTLAFEVSDGPHRLVVNCGGARAGGPGMAPALVQGLRTTAAHSTLTLSDSNSTSIHSDGSLGKGVEEVELDRQEAEIGSRIEASHDGYGRRFGFVHKRSMSVGPDGREIRGDDVLLPAKVRRKGQAATFAVRFHLGPDVEVSPTADGNGALLRIAEGPLWQFRSHGGALAIDDSLWVDGNGRIRGTQQLVISGEVPAGGASVSWAFRRAG